MLRTASIALAVIGSLAAVAPAAADVVVKVKPGGYYGRGAYVAPYYRPPAVVVRPGAVVVRPAPVYVQPTRVKRCTNVTKKVVVVKPNGNKVVTYKPVQECRWVYR
jgi:hypothetical protein